MLKHDDAGLPENFQANSKTIGLLYSL